MLVGFTCPRDGKDYKFDWCIRKCPEHCEPLPLLLNLMKNRAVIENEYHVTEILNPQQIIYLTRNCDYYNTPHSLIWMTFGTAWHHVIENIDFVPRTKGEYFFIEEEFTEEITPNGFLVGKPDLYEAYTKTLWDFKTIKYYYTGEKLLKNDWDKTTYHWQLNIYRVYQYPKTKFMKIEALIKDHNKTIEKKGVPPIIQIDVPFIDDSIVKRRVESTLEDALDIQKSGQYPECTLEERWNGIRCKSYCSVSKICKQNKGGK